MCLNKSNTHMRFWLLWTSKIFSVYTVGPGDKTPSRDYTTITPPAAASHSQLHSTSTWVPGRLSLKSSDFKRDFCSCCAEKALPVTAGDSEKPICIMSAAVSAHVVCVDSGWEAGNDHVVLIDLVRWVSDRVAAIHMHLMLVTSPILLAVLVLVPNHGTCTIWIEPSRIWIESRPRGQISLTGFHLVTAVDNAFILVSPWTSILYA